MPVMPGAHRHAKPPGLEKGRDRQDTCSGQKVPTGMGVRIGGRLPAFKEFVKTRKDESEFESMLK